MNINTNTNTITLNKVTYSILKANTPESLEAEGLRNLAKDLRASGVARQLFLQRVNGRKLFIALQGVNGVYSTVSAV